MAELGLVASVIGVAGAGAKLAIALYDIANCIASADNEVYTIAAEVSSFAQVLGFISKSLEGETTAAKQGGSIAKNIVVQCENVLAELTRLLKPLQIWSISSTKEKFHIARRVKWLLMKPKVVLQRRSLESLKTTLALFVATLDYAEVSETHAPLRIRDAYKSQVQSLVINSNMAAQALAGDAQIGLVVEESEDTITNVSSEEGLTLDVLKNHNPTQYEQREDAEQITELDRRETPERKSAACIAPSFQATPIMRGVQPSEDESDAFNEGMKDSLSLTVSSTIEVVQIQHAVRDLAQAVIHAQEEQYVWGWRSSIRSTRDNVFEDLKASADSEGFVPDLSTTDKGLPVQSEPRGLDDGQKKVSGTASESVFRLKEINSKLNSLEAMIRAGAQERPASQLEDELSARERSTKGDLLSRLSALVNENEETKHKQEPIYFHDVIGRKFNFPFEVCSKWRHMETLINQAFQHIENIGEHVKQGHYDLLGPKGEVILPAVWEVTVEPGWKVTQQLWPLPEPGPIQEYEGTLTLDDILGKTRAEESDNRSGQPQKRGFWKRKPVVPKKPGDLTSWMLRRSSFSRKPRDDKVDDFE